VAGAGDGSLAFSAEQAASKMLNVTGNQINFIFIFMPSS
jgi:hypothetical protein